MLQGQGIFIAAQPEGRRAQLGQTAQVFSFLSSFVEAQLVQKEVKDLEKKEQEKW